MPATVTPYLGYSDWGSNGRNRIWHIATRLDPPPYGQRQLALCGIYISVMRTTYDPIYQTAMCQKCLRHYQKGVSQ